MGYLFDICICDDMCNSNLFVRICFFPFVIGSLERFEKLEIFCLHDVFFCTMLSMKKKEKGCEVYGKQRIQGSSDVF